MSFYERFTSLCHEHGIVPSNIGQYIGISITSAGVSRWKDGVIPRNATLKAIADFFHVDVAYLLGKENEPDLKNTTSCTICPCKDDCQCNLSSQEHQIINMYRSLSEMGKMRMITNIMAVWDKDQEGGE